MMLENHRNTIVLVDENGSDLFNQDGSRSKLGKMEVHSRGLLHRAISVFIFNEKNELLLQKRASNKYHSPLKWSNTCCTHPWPEEAPLAAAKRCLKEEMGIVANITEVLTFSYIADVGNGLIENEFDHIFSGVSNQKPNPNPTEVAEWNWVSVKELRHKLIMNPEEYSPWLQESYSQVIKHMLPD